MRPRAGRRRRRRRRGRARPGGPGGASGPGQGGVASLVRGRRAAAPADRRPGGRRRRAFGPPSRHRLPERAGWGHRLPAPGPRGPRPLPRRPRHRRRAGRPGSRCGSRSRRSQRACATPPGSRPGCEPRRSPGWVRASRWRGRRARRRCGAARLVRVAVLGKGRLPTPERATESTTSVSICARTSTERRPRGPRGPASARQDGGIVRASDRSRSASATLGAGSQRASKPRPSGAATSPGRKRPRAASSRPNSTVAARWSNDASAEVPSNRPARRREMAAPGSNASVGIVQGSRSAAAAPSCGGAAAMRGEGQGFAVSPGSARISRPGRAPPTRPASAAIAASTASATPSDAAAHG